MNVIVIGAGIMGTTFAALAKEMAPELEITLLERLDSVGSGNLAAFNNAGTGEAALNPILRRKRHDVTIKHSHHPTSFQPERFDLFVGIDAWVVLLSDAYDGDFAEQFLERYADKPTLFLFEPSQRRRTRSFNKISAPERHDQGFTLPENPEPFLLHNLKHDLPAISSQPVKLCLHFLKGQAGRAKKDGAAPPFDSVNHLVFSETRATRTPSLVDRQTNKPGNQPAHHSLSVAGQEKSACAWVMPHSGTGDLEGESPKLVQVLDFDRCGWRRACITAITTTMPAVTT